MGILYISLMIMIGGLCALMLVQTVQLKNTQQQLEDERATNAWRTTRCKKCGAREVESSIRQTARVKDSKRRARIRKGSGHNA